MEPSFVQALATLAALTLAATGPAARAADLFPHQDRQPTPEELAKLPAVDAAAVDALLKEVKAPEGFEVSIFATPPAVNYPVFVAADVDGTLYVSSDGNGSLDRKPHLGRVLRVRDTDRDGKADEVRAFVPDVDSPRGLVWDHDRLYLLHPPDLSVFIDHNRDGVVDERRTLVRGIAFGFKDRPADHSSNGLELGVDGWLYVAIGDFGFMEAVGTDGRKLQLRGGGVVRLRPDGTELELWAEGTRNILEVAVSPLLDGFARDNTNDGGGWDVRLHHFSGGVTQHGYPKLFKNFADEIVPPLADYGGGSGCGAAWIDEPGIPAAWNNAPFTADWGNERIYHHGLQPRGATYTASQEVFAGLPRVTDLDVDGRSAIFAASWKGASFTWVGPKVGFIARLTPRGYLPEPLPEISAATPAELVTLLQSPSHRRRLAAQRMLLAREDGRAVRETPALLRDVAADTNRVLASRVAAVFGLKQALGNAAHGPLQALLTDPTVAPWAMRALGDRTSQREGIDPKRLVAALKSADPVLRKETVIALARLGLSDYAGSITAVLADPDPVVAHTAVQAMIQLRGVNACLPLVDHAKPASAIRTAALRVLQGLPEAEVVSALLQRLEVERRPEYRPGLLTALCRLHFIEGPWKGDSWGTRPDTRGPFYQPEPWAETPRITTALRRVLESGEKSEAAFLAREMARHRIPVGDAVETLISRASADPSLAPSLASQLASADSTPDAAIPLLATLARADATPDAARAEAVIALARTGSTEAWTAILASHARVQQTKSENNLAEKARQAVLNPPRLDQLEEVLAAGAARLDGESSLLAESLLLKLASSKLGAPEAREAARRSVDAAWADPRRRVQILKAAPRVRDASRAAQFVAALDDADPAVAQAAAEAVKQLRLDPEKVRARAAEPKVGDLQVAAVLESVATARGDVARGEQLFGQLSCAGCHTTRANEALKGPFLGTIASLYKRRELAEAILTPNKTLAQGFITHHFELKDGTEHDGFVVLEAADAVTIRNVAAQEVKIPVAEIARRERQERSLMPEGLAAGLTLGEFASLLDFLESLPARNAKP